MSGDFTKVKFMSFPRSVVMGHGVIDQTREICDSLLFGKNGIIVTGEKTFDAAGKTVYDLMSEKYEMTKVFVGNSDHDDIEKATAAAKDCDAKFVLAVGGGSKIDISKIVSNNLRIPFVSIPTSVAHDGICSDRASVKDEKGAPMTIQAMPPMAVIADTEVLLKAPYRFLASGCADVISNLTALWDWDFARRMKDEEFSTSAYTLAHYSAQSLVDYADFIKPGMEESIWLALKPIIASGTSMCIAGSSRPTSGSEHMFSHALDILHPSSAMHGEQCGVGCIMMTQLQSGNWKVIRDALKKIGAPTTASELGLSEEDIVDALVAANKVRKDRFTILGDNGLTRNAAYNLARTTGVI
ncbi:Glycerol dehydrogenase-related enzyme [Thermoplasmatales archaeon BRNA1]|nr:Glycerol dehydrogenase-related enzyme [Thermoplasmatales archaeon BRNA1]